MKQSSKIISSLIFLPLAVSSYAQDNRPNIIFILADDMGIGDVGVYGQKLIPTPNIDNLAKSGMTFTNHYSGSTVSAPSRCALLTGKDTGHGYIRGNKGVETCEGSFDLHLPESEITIAELLQKGGYATMCVGKWGLGGPNTSGAPTAKGFDYFYGYLSQGAAHHYYPDHLYENNNRVELEGRCYSHFKVMEKGMKFIEDNDDKPIFAYFALTPPHADLDYPDISKFKGKFDETPYINDRPTGFLTQEYPRATYAAMVSEVDKSVGAVVSLLKEKGELDNTIIIFSSDNGVHSVGGHDPEYFDSNSIYRGWKRDLYEGGIRTPFIVRWSDKIDAGMVSDHISTFWDFMPTVCDITGIKTPKNISGISYLPTLLNEGKQKEHKYLYYEFFEQGGKQCVIKDGWKLVRLNVSKKDKSHEELYNMNTDQAETNNLIKTEIKKGDALRKIMDSHRTENENFKF